MQTLRLLCRYCADFCTKKCSVEALYLRCVHACIAYVVDFFGFSGAIRCFFDGKRSLLCGGYALLSRHELCRIYVLFWSGFDADFYADIEDFVQILCRFLHKKMLVGSSVLKSWFES